MMFFSSDLHFNHAMVCEYCSRPFQTLDDMNQTLIKNWNNRITNEDTIYFLGDVFMGRRWDAPPLLEQLNGIKFLVPGNHDKSAKKILRNYFTILEKHHILNIDGKEIFLVHNPQYGDDYFQDLHKPQMIYLCGHVHEKWKTKGKWHNVGVDVRQFEPKTLQEIIDEDGDL